MPTGAELIALERTRQIEQEGWTPEHDDMLQNGGDLTLAAVSYSLDVCARLCIARDFPQPATLYRKQSRIDWPWDWEWWKPTPANDVRQLVKAGALIAAEIDRLQRQQEKQ